jgi:acyl-homoserine lactone synthase
MLASSQMGAEDMVIVETGCAGPAGNATLRAMFEDRKSVFVDLLKWDLPVLEGRFELDEFDDEHATYVIVADEAGDHLGSARLLPTTGRHILGDLFARLCAAPPPTGDHVVEITRFCLSRRQSAAARLKTRNQLVAALAQHALETGIRTFTGVAGMSWLQQILAFGWDCRPLGPPARVECGTIGALAIEITPETPGLLAANGIIAPAGEARPPLRQAA